MVIQPAYGFSEPSNDERDGRIRALLTDLPSTHAAVVRAALELRAGQLARALALAEGAIYRSDFELPSVC